MNNTRFAPVDKNKFAPIDKNSRLFEWVHFLTSFLTWSEVIVMNSTTTAKPTNESQSLFSHWGILEQLVSDNGPQFKSAKFAQILNENVTKHSTTAPYCLPQMSKLKGLFKQ